MHKETNLLYNIDKNNFNFLKAELEKNPDINTIIFNRIGDNNIFSLGIDNPFYEKPQSNESNVVIKWMRDIIDIANGNWDTEDELCNMITTYAKAVIATVERN